MNIHKDDLKSNFFFRNEFITAPWWKCMVDIFGDVATDCFLKETVVPGWAWKL